MYAGIESECFGENVTGENLESKAFLQVYKSVLNSTATEDSLVRLSHFAIVHALYVEYQNSYIQKLQQSIPMTFIPKTAVQFCQVGTWSWQIQLPTPMEPIPEARHSLSPMCFFNGGS
uniref:Uncharacterized protein n=1 Tax=Arundo donax TaxID=35708 RepID=A0A0A9DAD5_ARUDO